MKFRVALLVALAALLLTASLALATTTANGTAPATPVAPSADTAAPQGGASSCGVLGLLAFNPAPLPMAGDTCGACSDTLCAGKTVGSVCGSAANGVCVSTIACVSNQKTCRCILP